MLVHVHCARACVDAAKEFPYLMSYKDTLKNLYILHVTGSGMMNESNLKLNGPISIHWLAKENAVKTIHKCSGSFVMYLQSNEGKNTVGDCIAELLLEDV